MLGMLSSETAVEDHTGRTELPDRFEVKRLAEENLEDWIRKPRTKHVSPDRTDLRANAVWLDE
jgi:hypothetical protein